MSICQKIIQQTEELFECSLFDEYVRIETPFMYPDGDILDLFYRKDSPYKIITDLGGASDWLGLQTLADHRTARQENQIEYICESYRIEFRKGEFFIDLEKGNETRNLAEAIFDLGQAIVRITSLWFLQINKTKNQIISSIEVFMQSNKINYEKNKKFQGSSGEEWKPNFYTDNRTEKFLIYVLSTDKKNSTSNMIYRINAAWDDLEYLRDENYKFMSLFDDSYNVWKPSQKKILKKKSILKKFSNRNDLKNTLIGIN